VTIDMELLLRRQRREMLMDWGLLHWGDPLPQHRPTIHLRWEGLWTPKPPTPALVWEGGPHDWAVTWSLSAKGHSREDGWFSEPENGFILCYYPL
jgi:hypothetical protein